MSAEKSKNTWEKNVYGAGLQLNLWAYPEVLGPLKRVLADWAFDRRPKLLEVGSGAGNNLLALAQMGFETHGVEISKTANLFAKNRFNAAGLEVFLSECSMSELPFSDGEFDFVLDRGAVTHVPKTETPAALAEISRVLSRSGTFFSYNLFGDEHPDIEFGVALDNGSYDSFSEGQFQAVGVTTFFSEEEISKLFSIFDGVEIFRTRKLNGPKVTMDFFEVVATAQS